MLLPLQAIRVIKAILKLSNLSEDEPSTAAFLSARGGNLRCMSCPGWIVMDFDSAVSCCPDCKVSSV